MASTPPLLPSDREIAEALFGSDKEAAKAFLSSIPHLENDGFPKKSVVFGKRYWPAVKAYLDARLGIRPDGGMPLAEDGTENWDEPPRRRARA